eukprot:CAMPEP_0116549840 /NCGR_PEP_ID=MMETSP0397-20121206/5100_1 /TAXON_ID=216820 /ORGANISM="Cyclophora tenuis, Strain ECT3854" /LENGTH=227 /DNA_ID=CAMNT_0004074615 /DNA_START=200 /DNA_END=886 /DNA_ORIENTATION=+
MDKLDRYNGMAPLHYAAIHNNIHVIEHLIREGGANRELQDEEGRTAMYYAQRDNMQPSIVTLRELGAEYSKLYEMEENGELAQEARGWEMERQERKERKQQQEEKEQAEMQKILSQGAATVDGRDPAERPSPKKGKSFLGLSLPGLGGGGANNNKAPSNADDAKGLAQQAHANMNDALNALRERGEKINELGDKAADLENNAQEYTSLASRLREKMERKNRNPFSRR